VDLIARQAANGAGRLSVNGHYKNFAPTEPIIRSIDQSESRDKTLLSNDFFAA
jgi:hypothetical protein